jgi:hypothetical protein
MAPPRALVDVQPLLAAACAELPVGALLEAPAFSLLDAMTAIEIGDAKMDAGLRGGGAAAPAPAPEALAAAGAAPAELAPRALLALLDRLMAAEATWFAAGAMIPTSVFASLYLLLPARLAAASPPLHAAALGLRAAVTLGADLVVGGQVCEDEDVLPHAFGARLDPPGAAAPAAARAALAAAEAALAAGGAAAQVVGGHAFEPAERAALAARLRFRRLVLDVLEAVQAREQSVAALGALAARADEAAAALDFVMASASAEEDAAAAPGFAPEVNRALMGLAPPRNVATLTVAAAAAAWRGVLGGVAEAARALAAVDGWCALRAALTELAARPNRPLVRAATHMLLVRPLGLPLAPAAAASGATAAADAPLNAGAAAVPAAAAAAPAAAANTADAGAPRAEPAAPPPAPAPAPPPWCPSRAMIAAEFGFDPAAPPGEDAAIFVAECAVAAQGLAHTMCLNRCRRRRRLRRLLEDWRNMLDHAFNVEAAPEARTHFAARGWRWAPVNAAGELVSVRFLLFVYCVASLLLRYYSSGAAGA